MAFQYDLKTVFDHILPFVIEAYGSDPGGRNLEGCGVNQGDHEGNRFLPK